MMKKTLRNVLLFMLSVLACCMFAACEPDVCEHQYESECTCIDRACTVEGCEHVEPASTEHAYGEWVEIIEPGCDTTGLKRRTCACGAAEEETIPAAGHEYADELTCHDRKCIVDGCDYVLPASTEHEWGEWVEVTPATCQQVGQKKRVCTDCNAEELEDVTVGHEFVDGVCTGCEKTYQQLLIGLLNPVNELMYDSAKGTYSILSKEEKFDAYACIEGSMLTYLNEVVGLDKLTITITNPAPGLCDATDKCKGFMMATTDDTWHGNNLWAEETAIAYWGWQKFWDNGKTATFELNLRMYAGTNIIMYTSQSGKYPLQITVKEFVDLSSFENYVIAGDNASVEYIDETGWKVSSTATGAYYVKINQEIVQNNIANGLDHLVLTFVNHFGTNENTGAFVNSQFAILPEKVEGGNDWYYANGWMSAITENLETSINTVVRPADGSMVFVLDLTNEAYNWAEPIELYFGGKDVSGNATPIAYIKSIEFKSAEGHEHLINHIGECAYCGVSYSDPVTFFENGNNGNVTYTEGTGWEIASMGDTAGIYWKMPAEVIQKGMEGGKNFLRITFVNHFGTTNNVGNFVNTQTAILPEKAAGGNDWTYANGFISQIAAGLADGSYFFIVDLTNSDYDWTKDLEFYVKQSDVSNNAISSAYISKVEFMDEAGYPAESMLTAKKDCSVAYTEGTGYTITASATGGFYAVIPAAAIQWHVKQGCTSMTINFVDHFGTNGNVGHFVNTQIAILPQKAAGGNDWNYKNGFISQLTSSDGTGVFPVTIDLTNATYDWTKDVQIYVAANDVNKAAISVGYIKSIVFNK